MGRVACLFAVAAFSACAHGAAPEGAGADGPTAYEFNWAMHGSLPREVDGRPVMMAHCLPVSRLQCRRQRDGGRHRCTYRFGDGERGSAMLERGGDGGWQWVSGASRCSMTLM